MSLTSGQNCGFAHREVNVLKKYEKGFWRKTQVGGMEKLSLSVFSLNFSNSKMDSLNFFWVYLQLENYWNRGSLRIVLQCTIRSTQTVSSPCLAVAQSRYARMDSKGSHLFRRQIQEVGIRRLRAAQFLPNAQSILHPAKLHVWGSLLDYPRCRRQSSLRFAKELSAGRKPAPQGERGLT